jgi:DNA-binding transcriptional regulator/RsmH inhibitor MraZ
VASSYTSTADYTLDDKGRVALPLSLRQNLEAANRRSDAVRDAIASGDVDINKMVKTVMLFFNAENGCIEGFDRVYPERFRADMEERAKGDPLLLDALLADFFGGLVEAAYDSGGRVVIPDSLRAKAGFKDKDRVRVVGGGYKFMIWAPAKHDAWLLKQAELRAKILAKSREAAGV